MHTHFQAIVDAYAAADRPFFHQVTPAEARDMLRAAQSAAPPQVDLPVLASVNDEQVDGPHGGIGIRRYLPTGEVVGTCVFCHAGGWVIGDLDTADNLCRRLAGRAGVEVISVDYRLAPECAFPVPLDDVYAVLHWANTLQRPLTLAGESAGANLAAACAIRVREEGGPPIVGQFLAYPITDHNFETESYTSIGPKNWLLSRADMQWFWDHYCPSPLDRSNPLASPLQLSSAAGLPQTLLLVAELDPLRDEGLAYAQLLKAHGVSVIVKEGKGMLHGYLNAAGAIPEVAAMVETAAEWMRACIVNSSGDSLL
jgi:acetyl esterase/lipase